VVRSEHRTDGGHDDVERLVLERQVLRVGLHPFELDTLLLRAGTACVEELGCQIACGDLRAGLRRGDRRVAGAGGHVEDLHARRDPTGLDEARAQWEQEGLDHLRVVARRPHGAVTGLQL
jgi:hypothetical protein